jgi:hypothetical protein
VFKGSGFRVQRFRVQGFQVQMLDVRFEVYGCWLLPVASDI